MSWSSGNQSQFKTNQTRTNEINDIPTPAQAVKTAEKIKTKRGLIRKWWSLQNHLFFGVRVRSRRTVVRGGQVASISDNGLGMSEFQVITTWTLDEEISEVYARESLFNDESGRNH
jgi:hypothetical protein